MRSRLGDLCYMCHRLTGRKVFLWEWWLSGYLALLGGHGVFYAMRYTFLANSWNLSGPHLRGGICRKNVTSSNQWSHVHRYHRQRLELLRLLTKWPNPPKQSTTSRVTLNIRQVAELSQITISRRNLQRGGMYKFGKHRSSDTIDNVKNKLNYSPGGRTPWRILQYHRHHRQCEKQS